MIYLTPNIVLVHNLIGSRNMLTLFPLGSEMTLSPGGSFWPALVFSCTTWWKVMLPQKKNSQMFILIFSHTLIPLFQLSRKSDPLFLSLKVNQHGEILKHQRVPPLKQKKKLWDPLTIRISNYFLFERELALLVALQGESIWKGGGGGNHS